jgi:CheY-like chemotaxis protein
MLSGHVHLLLADDDEDDCMLFQTALEELSVSAKLDTVSDGYQLMQYLYKNWQELPQILFLDLNMPCKNGFECLIEMKRDKHLKLMPVVIFSTSYDQTMVDGLFQNGAHHYIRKPEAFETLKNLIRQAIIFTLEEELPRSRENFVIL